MNLIVVNDELRNTEEAFSALSEKRTDFEVEMTWMKGYYHHRPATNLASTTWKEFVSRRIRVHFGVGQILIPLNQDVNERQIVVISMSG